MKIKTKQIAEVRAEVLNSQCGRCAICQREPKVPVLDHLHSEGYVRGVLCNTCNALEGRFLKLLKRYAVPVDKFYSGLIQYYDWHSVDRTGLIHPTYKTDEEKRVLGKKRRARKNVK